MENTVKENLFASGIFAILLVANAVTFVLGYWLGTR